MKLFGKKYPASYHCGVSPSINEDFCATHFKRDSRARTAEWPRDWMAPVLVSKVRQSPDPGTLAFPPWMHAVGFDDQLFAKPAHEINRM